MRPSLLPGDVVLVLPVAPREGDIVALADPLDPARFTLRRVESIGGAVRYDGRSFRTGSRPKVRLLDMGEHEGRPVLLEQEHVTLRAVDPTREEFADRYVPDDSAFLSADNRDEAVDSRWWGPVPLTHIGGVVVARVGAPTTPWRGVYGGRGEPAVVPKSSKLRPG
jgi:signal peptidase I